MMLGGHLETERGKRDAIIHISASSFKDMYISNKPVNRSHEENNQNSSNTSQSNSHLNQRDRVEKTSNV